VLQNKLQRADEQNKSNSTLQSLYTALTKNPCMGRYDFPQIQSTLYRKTGKEHNQVTITCCIGGIVKKHQEESGQGEE
jgi:hypothetical protein